ncbi:MAG: PQQ-binding-like beta-propeller repeat protein [Treponema sp.]|nr:PQQ-binding-like beta-propeller repeat protein [Treponema sp.]
MKNKLLALAAFISCLHILPAFTADKASAKEEPPSYPVLDLSQSKPSKVTVLGGAALTEAVRNESGYMIPIEGKILYAFDGEGNAVWTHGLSSKPDSLSAGLGGLLYAVSRKTTLCMISPGGRELWKTRPGFNIEGNPLAGRDGRVYVRGGGKIACYGLKGTRRWTADVDGQDTALPLMELNDGRLLVFLTKTEGGKSCALTMSPFGQAMEELTFTGLVKAASPCGDGVLLSFADGAIGLFSVQDGKCISKWIKPASQTGFSSSAEIVTDVFSSRTAAFISGSPARLLYVNTQTGAIEMEGKTGINASALRYKAVTAQGLALADGGTAECYSSEALPVWKAKYSNASSWTYMFITDEGCISFMGKDWVISTYRVKQSLSSAQESSYKEKTATQYFSFYSNSLLNSSDIYGRAVSSQQSLEMMEDWKNGDFGEREQDYISLLNKEINSISTAYSSSASSRGSDGSYYLTNLAYCKEIFALASYSQLASFSPTIARLLVKTSGSPLSTSLVKAAGETAFDADGALIDALLYTARHTPTSGSDVTLMAICDATYEICRFMGRPTFMKKGNAILSYLLYPQFSQRVHDYAKKTLDKIMEEKL